MRYLWPCGRWPEVATGFGVLTWVVWTVTNYENVPAVFLSAALFAPITLVYLLPRITEFIYYDRAARLEYRGELRGNAAVAFDKNKNKWVSDKWVAETGTMRLRQYNQGIGSADALKLALRKKENVWVICRVNADSDANRVLNPGLLETFARVERRVNKWRLFRVTWRAGI